MHGAAAPLILFFAGLCSLALGILLRRRWPAAAWIPLIGGYGLLAVLALGHLGGRFGAAQLWFRAPTFYLSVPILLAGAAWWVMRPASRWVRLGIPGILLIAGIAMLTLLRLHGASAPLAMLMPTMSEPAPDFAWRDASGRAHRLSDYQGKVVLINFWATWCTPCRREMPLLSSLQRRFGDDGFVVVYLSLEEPQVLDAFLAKSDFAGVHGRLSGAPAFYGAGKFYPLSYLIDREGRVEERWSGRPSEHWLESVIRAEL
jgi:thiol-disulfide isomerase/thioredoxin